MNSLWKTKSGEICICNFFLKICRREKFWFVFVDNYFRQKFCKKIDFKKCYLSKISNLKFCSPKNLQKKFCDFLKLKKVLAYEKFMKFTKTNYNRFGGALWIWLSHWFFLCICIRSVRNLTPIQSIFSFYHNTYIMWVCTRAAKKLTVTAFFTQSEVFKVIITGRTRAHSFTKINTYINQNASPQSVAFKLMNFDHASITLHH